MKRPGDTLTSGRLDEESGPKESSFRGLSTNPWLIGRNSLVFYHHYQLSSCVSDQKGYQGLGIVVRYAICDHRQYWNDYLDAIP